MTSCQAQTCTQHLNNIQGSIYHKLWGGWHRISRWRWCWCWGWWWWCCRCDGEAPLHQGGVDGVDGGDFPLVALANQSFRRWKKGSASATSSKNYEKNRASLFSQNECVHKKTETRRPPKARRDWVARSAWWVVPPVLIWASWLLLCVTTSLGASHVKILTL
jgi:hypothetical protein